MPRNRSLLWPITTAIIGLLLVIFALPQSSRQGAVEAIPEKVQPLFSPFSSAKLHYGLDLAGGTQLDFRISEAEMREQYDKLVAEIRAGEDAGLSAEELDRLRLQRDTIKTQQENIVESIRSVLERRINALGVSEAVITPSYLGGEKHLLVECPGVVDTQRCIETVGKTITLEFKEAQREVTDEFEDGVRQRVADAQRRMTESGEALTVVGQDLSDELGIAYLQGQMYFRDTLPQGLSDLWSKNPGETIYEREATLQVPGYDPDGRIVVQDVEGIFLAQVTRERTETGRTVTDLFAAMELLSQGDSTLSVETHSEIALDENVDQQISAALKSLQPGQARVAALSDGTARILALQDFVAGSRDMAASHILVAYQGATSADPSILRTKEEALLKAQDLKKQLDEGTSFATLAKQESDGPSGAEGGSLGIFNDTQMVPAFSDAAFVLNKGEISQITETAFGYHIIRADEQPVTKPDQASYTALRVEGEAASETAEGILAQIQRGEIQTTESAAFIDSLFFSLQPTGWKDTPLDGKHFRSASVVRDTYSNQPIVQITFDEEGGRMFQELTARNIGEQIAIFVGGDMVSAPVVQTEIAGGVAIITGLNGYQEAIELEQNLNTGAIPAPIYLSGQRTVEATLGAQALQTSLRAALIGVIILMLYMIIMYRALGLIADIALSIYALIFFVALKLPLFLLSSQHIVLTLAGMAGIILSIGMAVDANVLIFERMKEELRKGKMLTTAAETGFKRAWPSIRDGNVSTFITCAILFLIGTSIVRGFAVTLGMGVLISMFSAIVITRFLVRWVAGSSLAENRSLFLSKIRNPSDTTSPR